MKPAYTRIAALVAGLVFGALPVGVHAQQAPTTSVTTAVAPGKAMATATTKAQAVIVGLDPATRGITLKTAAGKTFDVVAGPEVKNFDQLKVGQKVTAAYAEALSLELKKGGGGVLAATEKTGAASAAGSDGRAGVAGRQVTVLADVVAVDSKTHLVTLRGPKGRTVDLHVNDPEQLKNIKKGDQVEAVYTEAVAVAVEGATK